MDRRTFFGVLAAGAATLPLPVRAEPRKQRIQILIGTGKDAQGQGWIAAFQQKLRQLGWAKGHNAEINLTWGGGDIDFIRASAAKIVQSKPDVIFVYSVRVLNAVRKKTRKIPVVFIATNDPVGLGIVDSLAQPGGNLTGFMLYEVSVAGKLVELIKELKPHLATVALLYNPNNSSAMPYWRLIQAIAKSNGITAVSFPVSDAASIKQAIGAFAPRVNGGIVLPADVTTTVHRNLIVKLAAQYRLPVVYSFSSVVADGGLISYGPNTTDLFMRAASYVDKILRGKPASSLPVQAPTKFTLAVNLRTAKAMGIEVPTSILLRADEVID